MGIVHGDLRTVRLASIVFDCVKLLTPRSPDAQANILVDNDGIPHIAGLGNAHILPHSTPWALKDGAVVDQLSYDSPPELTWSGTFSNLTDVPTKAYNMYAFGVMAYEVRADSLWHCSTHSLKTAPHGKDPILWDDGNRGKPLDVERIETTTA